MPAPSHPNADMLGSSGSGTALPPPFWMHQQAPGAGVGEAPMVVASHPSEGPIDPISRSCYGQQTVNGIGY